MKRGSLRFKLTIWNLAVLAVTLTAFGLALGISNQRRIAGDIDRDLRMRGTRAAQGPPRFLGGNQRVDGPAPPGMMRRQGQIGEPPQGVRIRDDQPPEPREPPNGPLMRLRQVQFFNSSGQLIAPDSTMKPFDKNLLPRALAGEEGFSTVDYNGEKLRVFAAPQFTLDGIAGAVEVARELRDFEAAGEAQTRTLLLLLPIALLAAGAGALFLTNRALKPVAEVTQAAARIEASDLSHRLKVTGDDELAEMSRTFNAMIERLEGSFGSLKLAYEAVEQAYDAHRRFTADASHELRTPLTRLRLATSAALSGPAEPKAMLESLKIADQAGDSMSRLVQQLLLLSRADTGSLGLQRQPMDLRVAVTDAADLTPKPEGITLDVAVPSQPITVLGDEDHLRRVVVNLLENAFRHTPSGGAVRVSVQQSEQNAVIEVSDTGEGIAAAHLPYLFERFYRVDASRSRDDGGCGLGLAIVKSIIEAHDGKVEVRSEVGKGTTVIVDLGLLI